MTISITPRKVLWLLAGIGAALVLASLAGQVSAFGFGHNHVFGLVPLFDLNEEKNIPSLFSSLLLMMAAMMLALIARARRRLGEGDHRWWMGLAVVFLFLAVDEAVSIHERLNRPVHDFMHASGIFYFAWVIPYALLAGLCFMLYARFLWSLPPLTRRRVLLAGLIYVGGAVGTELLGGWLVDRLGARHSLQYALLTTLEESMEMGGATYFIYALLCYVETALAPLAVVIG